jgi:hypothetical protein
MHDDRVWRRIFPATNKGKLSLSCHAGWSYYSYFWNAPWTADWTTAKLPSTEVNTKQAEQLTLYVHVPNGFRIMTSAWEWSEEVRVLDLTTKRLGGFRTVNTRVGFRKVIFLFLRNSYTEHLQARVRLHGFAGMSSGLLCGQGTCIN